MFIFTAKQKTQIMTFNLQKTYKHFGGKIELIMITIINDFEA